MEDTTLWCVQRAHCLTLPFPIKSLDDPEMRLLALETLVTFIENVSTRKTVAPFVQQLLFALLKVG